MLKDKQKMWMPQFARQLQLKNKILYILKEEDNNCHWSTKNGRKWRSTMKTVGVSNLVKALMASIFAL